MNIDALEWIGAAVSVAAVWLAARRHMLGWPVGLASVALYALVFVDARLYSDALLQVAFAGFIVYGWRRWKANLDDDGLVRVAALAPGAALRDLGLGALGALLLGFCMHRYTDAALPWLDAALTAFSLVAQWWQGRRHVAAWWLWIPRSSARRCWTSTCPPRAATENASVRALDGMGSAHPQRFSSRPVTALACLANSASP